MEKEKKQFFEESVDRVMENEFESEEEREKFMKELDAPITITAREFMMMCLEVEDELVRSLQLVGMKKDAVGFIHDLQSEFVGTITEKLLRFEEEKTC